MSYDKHYVIPNYSGLVSVPLLSAALVAGLIGVYHVHQDAVSSAFAFIFPAGVTYQLLPFVLERLSWRKHTYAWYVTHFSDHVRQGRVSCRHCGSQNIRTHNLMRQSYTRAHSCNQCGQTLYFSPETR